MRRSWRRGRPAPTTATRTSSTPTSRYLTLCFIWFQDEKIQHVLGHFQKDFEGGVSADNLGPKFGGYGSFLPTYQHSPPMLPQTKSSHAAANVITSRSPYQPSAERMDIDLSTVVVQSISRNNGSIAHSTSNSSEGCSSTNSEQSVAGSDSLDSSFNGSDSKSLNVQMKLGSNNVLPRKNAAIYSGLGLDISSSSSMEESPDMLGGLSPDFRKVPYDESPQTILQVMTCFQVPGGFMLSPLHNNVLQLSNKVAPLLKKWEAHLGMENGLIERPFLKTMETPMSHKRKRTVDDEDNFEKGSVSKHDLGPMSKLADLVPEKEKCTSHSDYSEGGDLKERTTAHLMLRTKRGIDQDKYETVKKTRREDQNQINRDQDYECDSAGGEVAGEPKAFPAKAKVMESSLETGDVSLRKEKTASGYDLLENTTRINDVEVFCTSVKLDASQMEALSRRSNVKNGVEHVTVRPTGSKSSDASPIGKNSSMVAFALKEARDLKHKANNLKNKGLELESTGLYFEAALKFLHVAFLLETPNFDSLRRGDAAPSMKMYSETAKLCKFCAHEYERSNKMAAAALAYKCVEVAYLKAAYYKNPRASKDREELQELVRISQGEPTSSFGADIDNINSHGLSKFSSANDGSSSQVAGKRLTLAAHKQAHLLRLLAYTNDVNGAFDATRKSQIAIVSASGSQGKKGMDDSLASVKTVLNFNFNNVNELLRLVRLSMGSISI